MTVQIGRYRPWQDDVSLVRYIVIKIVRQCLPDETREGACVRVGAPPAPPRRLAAALSVDVRLIEAKRSMTPWRSFIYSYGSIRISNFISLSFKAGSILMRRSS